MIMRNEALPGLYGWFEIPAHLQKWRKESTSLSWPANTERYRIAWMRVYLLMWTCQSLGRRPGDSTNTNARFVTSMPGYPKWNFAKDAQDCCKRSRRGNGSIPPSFFTTASKLPTAKISDVLY